MMIVTRMANLRGPIPVTLTLLKHGGVGEGDTKGGEAWERGARTHIWAPTHKDLIRGYKGLSGLLKAYVHA